jgi:high-affinity iron transporter
MVSGLLGYFLWVNQGADQPLWEGIFALVTAVLVGSLVVHMWRIGPEFKRTMESRLSKAVSKPSTQAAYVAVLLFTIVMISREGMEMMLLLFQVRESPNLVVGIALGALGAGVIAVLWEQFSYLINWKHFFQVTTVFLLLMIVQIAVQAFHELTEAGIFPHSDMWHEVSEAYSSDGIYGRWYGMLTFFGCGAWLLLSFIYEKLQAPKIGNISPLDGTNR